MRVKAFLASAFCLLPFAFLEAQTQSVNAAGASGASAPAPTDLVAEALRALTRLRPSAELFIYGAARPAELALVAEIPNNQVEGGKWAQGGDAQATVTGPNGEPVGAASGRIPPASRGVLLVVPLAANAAGPWRVEVKVTAGNARLEDRATIEAAKPTALLGSPVIYRAASGPRAPIRPVADFQFRRTERVHVEWPILKSLDQRQARLLGQKGQPLAVTVTLTETARGRRDDSESAGAGATANGGGPPLALKDAATFLAVDVNLAPLGPADYVLEVIAGSGREHERRLLAIRIVQ